MLPLDVPGGPVMAPPKRPAVLIVEDESIVAHDLQQTLKSFGYDPYAIASSAEEALSRAAERRPDLALVNVRIKGRTDGIRAAQLLHERYGIPIVYLTAQADEATLERAKMTRPYGYLLKPGNPAELRSTIQIALYRHETETAAFKAKALPPAAAAPRTAARQGRVPGARAVRGQLERILANPDFDASRRSREFLRFIIEETLAGRGEALTQSAIATEAFGRKDDFDPVVDPIVRIQAGRLRRSLERYYLLSGKDDPVRIELPRGAYVPAFRARAESESGSAGEKPSPAGPRAAPLDGWPTVSISPFEPGRPGSEQAAQAARLTEELVLELGQYREVRSFLQRRPDELAVTSRESARFTLGGQVWEEGGEVRVASRLVDRASGEVLWGDEYHTVAGPARWSASLADIARVVAGRVGADEGVIVQFLAAERRNSKPSSITPYGAMLLSYEFFLTRDPERLAAALEALHQVVRTDPDSAVVWTRLGRVCFANHAFEVTAIPTPIDQAIAYAQNGVRLDPTSRRGRCILAASLLVKDELAAAREELEQALRLSPDSLVYLEIIGNFLTLLGDGERGPALIRTARARNPYALSNAAMGLWFDHLRRGEIELAYQDSIEYRDPTFFWRGVMRASCLGLLGRTADAAVEVADVLQRKPDFEARGRTLIGNIVKLPEVMGRVVEGLAKADLKLA